MDSRSLYEEDIYLWAEQQADALRRAAASGHVLSNELDLENLAEEIQDVGKSELRATSSLVKEAFAHLAKLAADPNSRAAVRWSGEVPRFLENAQAAYTPAMRRLIDLDKIWRDGMRLAYRDLRNYGVEIVPEFPVESPFSLEELLSADFDVQQAVERVRASLID